MAFHRVNLKLINRERERESLRPRGFLLEPLHYNILNYLEKTLIFLLSFISTLSFYLFASSVLLSYHLFLLSLSQPERPAYSFNWFSIIIKNAD